MPAALDQQARLVGQRRPDQPQRLRALGEGREDVERREALGAPLQRRHGGLQRVEQVVVERLLAGQRPLAGGQHPVLETLELGRDVALRALEGLTSRVVLGDARVVRAAELDVVAVHAVVADLECGDPGALALACLEVHEELVGVLRQRAQLVELGVVAGREHAAVADHHRRVLDHRPAEQAERVRVLAARGRERRRQRRREPAQEQLQPGQAGERVAQRREIAGPRGLEGDAGEDALDVADAGERVVQRRVRGAIDELGDRVVPGAHRAAVAERPVEPAPQEPAAHRRGAAVQQPRERVLGAARGGAVDLQVAARRRVDDHRVVPALHHEAGHVRQRRALRVGDVLQQAARGADRERQRRASEAGEVARAELAGEQALAAVGVEVPDRPAGQPVRARQARRQGEVLGQQQLGGAQALELAGEGLYACELLHREAPAAEVEDREAVAAARLAQRGEQVVAAFLEQRLVGDGPRGDDAHDAALDRALARGRIADLLADRDRLP